MEEATPAVSEGVPPIVLLQEDTSVEEQGERLEVCYKCGRCASLGLNHVLDGNEKTLDMWGMFFLAREWHIGCHVRRL